MPADDLAVEWMDYPNLARRLGTTHDAARQRAKRGRWARRRGNDGGWQVGVPVEALDDHKRDRDPQGDHENEGDHAGDHDHKPVGGREGDHVDALNAITTTFTRHIERLEQALAEAKEKTEALERERDEARTEAAGKAALTAQVEALNTVLAIERERIAEMKEAERLRVEETRQRADEARQRTQELQAERNRWSAAAAAAQERIEQLTTKAAEAEKSRGWWPWRRAG